MDRVGSKLISETVDLLSSLPGIGKKSALRMTLHLAQSENSKSQKIATILHKLATDLKICQSCFLYADEERCDICKNPSRNSKQICVVESIKDVIAIEETNQFNGKYHVLGGLISPIDGISPESLTINALLGRIKSEDVAELIMAIRPSIEGDTTIYYISKMLPDPEIKISLIARGVSFGADLEFIDEITLGRSILSRTPYLIHDNSVV